MIFCRLFGHKWKFMGRAGMNDDHGSDYWIYECSRCGKYCRVSEKDNSEEIYA